MKTKKILIIGSGTGGLASAALLAKDGHKVTVLEKNEQLGGRASLLKEKGFKFDMGPSWYMMPDVFEKFFAQFGKKPSDYLKLVKLKPQYRVHFSDGTFVDIVDDLQKNIATFEQLEPGVTPRFQEYLRLAKKKYDLSVESVLYKNVDSVFDFFSWDILKNGPELDPFANMDEYIKRFFKTEKMQQIMLYTLVFLGGAPSNTPALYSLMAHVDFNLGTYYPKGGFYKLVEALVTVGKEQGVTYKTNAPVEKILTKNGRVTGVQLAGKKLRADVVISNADYAHTEQLLPQKERVYTDQYWQKKTFAPSAFLLYLGVKGKLPKLKHHTIYFGKDWLDHFTQIFDNPGWPITPSLYINKPTATDATVAPKGHENLMVLVPIASGLPENDLWKEQYADFVIKYIEQNLKIKLQNKIIYQKIFSVSDFATRYNSFAGNALGGLTHTLRQTAFLRPSNKHKKVENLFFAGASTVPGIGVPITVISGHLVRERVRGFWKE